MQIDQQVCGIGRKPTREIYALVEWISEHSAGVIEGSAKKIQSVKQSAVVQCFGSAIIGLILIIYYIREHFKAERKIAEMVLKAQAANEAKSAFLANISHKARAPLNGIFGMA